MSWIHYFLLAIVLLFVFQGIYYYLTKNIYFQKSSIARSYCCFFLQV